MAVTAAQLQVKVGADTRNAEQGLQKVSKLVRGVGSLALKAAGGMAAFFAVKGAAQSAQTLVDYSGKLEQSAIAWGTLLKSQAAGLDMMRRLQDFAKKTPFDYSGIEDAAKRLVAMGFAAKDVLPLMEDLGNAASALGLRTEGMNRLVLALGQMRAKTKVSGEEMRQLTEAGVPAWEILADAIGKTTQETMKLASQGRISSQVFIQAFQEYSRQNYGGMMEEQSRTFTGAISNIRDSLLQLGSTAFQPLFQQLSIGAQKFAEFLSSNRAMQFARDMASAMGNVIRGMREALDTVKQFGTSLARNSVVRRAIYTLVGWLEEQFGKLGKIIDLVIEHIKSAWKLFGDDIQAIVKGSFSSLVTSLKNLMMTIGKVIGLAMDILSGDWEGAWQKLRDIAYLVWANIVEVIANAVERVLRIVGAIYGAFGKEFPAEQWIGKIEEAKQGLLESSQAALKVSDDIANGATSVDKWAQYMARGEEIVDQVTSGLFKATQGMGDFRQASEATIDKVEQTTDALQNASAAAQNFGANLVNSLVLSHPAIAQTSFEILNLQQQIKGVNQAIAANRDAQQRLQERISRTQERVNSLKAELQGLQDRLRELSQPRLTGMGRLDMQIQALQDHLKRIELAKTLNKPLEEIMRRFPLLAEGAEEFIATLPQGKKALEDILRSLQLQRELTFAQQLRLLQQAAQEPAEEISFESAMREIATTKERIADVTQELSTQQLKLEKLQDRLQKLASGANSLNRAMQDLQQSLQDAQYRQSVLNEALQLAYNSKRC